MIQRTFEKDKPTPKDKINLLTRELNAGNRNKVIARKLYARTFHKLSPTNENTTIKTN